MKRNNPKTKENFNIKVAVVGYGYWGPNLVRNFSELEEVKLSACCDLRQERLNIVKRKYSQIYVTTKFEEILNDKTIDAVIIATPLSFHYRLAKQALLAGKHVWIEKPMVESYDQAKELIKLAEKVNKILHVDHIFIYTEAVRAMKKIIDSRELGKIYYFNSTRINLGLFQPDTNVIWDLATHDISIMCYLLGKMPSSVCAFGASHVNKKIEDTAFLNFRFQGGISAQIQVSWLSPVKIRQSLLVGSKRMIVYNDLETSEKLKIYDRRIAMKKDLSLTSSTTGYHYRTGDIFSPALEIKEALHTQASHFIKCIKFGRKTLTSGQEGLRVVKILEAASESLKIGGGMIKIHSISY
ncbi:MAG: Gfo/Idh/MocA family oxidoreductase [Candidatus Levybacteria bacterium]|nr:Gfo/Idh/MocA family oxidoreductase [Candidatus Levybacteria bacterium]